MPSRLDALRARMEESRANGFATVTMRYTLDEWAALLAVVEAAQDYRRNSIVLMGQDAIGTALDTALAAWTTEEEG